MEENNAPSTPKLICPKGESSYVGCFQTNFEFSLPRESCRQRSANEGEKCNPDIRDPDECIGDLDCGENAEGDYVCMQI